MTEHPVTDRNAVAPNHVPTLAWCAHHFAATEVALVASGASVHYDIREQLTARETEVSMIGGRA
jgi:hypothetical protein